jgi:3-methyladenine DNA glycosylase/8-oxoguanine DNA glycosylase
VGDYGVRKGFALAFAPTNGRGKETKKTRAGDALPDEAELTARAEAWRPYRSLVAWYLWRRTDLAAPPTTLA